MRVFAVIGIVGTLLGAVLFAVFKQPAPESEAGRKIYALMLEHEGLVGPTDVSRQVCVGLTDATLSQAAAEMPELQPRLNRVTKATASEPEGSIVATFKRGLGWPWTQTMFIVIKEDVGLCRAVLRNRST